MMGTKQRRFAPLINVSVEELVPQDHFYRYLEHILDLSFVRELYFDGTQVKANADLDSLTPRFAVEAREAMQGHLAALFPEADSQQEAVERVTDSPPPVDTSKDTTCSVPIPLPIVLPEVQREELEAENASRHDWIAQEGRQQREVHGLYRRTAD